MRKIKDVAFYIPLEVYAYNIFLVVSESQDVFYKFIKKQYVGELGNSVDEFIKTLGSGKYDDRCGVHYSVDIIPVKGKGYSESIIWLKEFDWTTWDYSILLHEVLHHVTEVFRVAHIKIEGGVDEPFTYYTTFVYKKVLDILNEYRKKN
jgi:hypothetical protein